MLLSKPIHNLNSKLCITQHTQHKQQLLKVVVYVVLIVLISVSEAHL